MKTAIDSIPSLVASNMAPEYIIEKPVQQNALDMLQQGCFTCRSMSEALDLAHFLAHCYPSPREALVGISELLKNAVEHGNLGLSYEEKRQHMIDGTLAQEIEQREHDVRYAHKAVQVMFDRLEDEIRLIISDEGKGFDWRPYLQYDPDRAEEPNGRGILLAKEITFDKLEYNQIGNMVIGSVTL